MTAYAVNSKNLINKKFIFFILLYSAVLHAAVLLVFLSTINRPRGINEHIFTTINSLKKVPYSVKLSLNGRKGNSYDKTKSNENFDLTSAKKTINESITKIAAYKSKINADILKNYRPEIKENQLKAVNETKVGTLPAPEHKLTIPEKKTKSKNNEQQAYNIKKKNIISKGKISASDNEDNLKKINKTGDKTADNKIPEPAGNPVNYFQNYSENNGVIKESYGNSSGTMNNGAETAGTPDGIKDPKLIASSMDIFKSFVSSKIKKNLKYPQNCRKLGIEGTVKLQFSIKNNGSLDGAKILSSAQNNDIDESALNALKSSEPFLPFPEELKNSEITFIIPLNYKLEDE